MSSMPTEASSQVFISKIHTQLLGRAESASHVSLWRMLVIFVAIASNAALLICQQVAIRLLAPLIGSSIETWSAIIGVFLLGIGLGSLVAGKLADRYQPDRLIAASLLLGSLTVFLMQPFASLLSDSNYFAALPLELQISLASVLICLLPGIALSLVTAPSIRSLVHCASEAGSASGRVFAWGTFGSLLGNYLTGFVLLAMFGVTAIIQVTWLALLGLAFIMWFAGQRVAPRLKQVEYQAESMQRAEKSTIKDPTFEAMAAETSWQLRALVIVITCSFVSGALEGAAFRILAALVGASMFLTAGVVGVVLTGMAIGNALGGVIARKYGTIDALKKSLILSAATTLLVSILWTQAVNHGLFCDLPVITKIVVWSFSLFLLPSLALGTITPQVIGLSVRDVQRTGAITGNLYGFSTLGCILGILVSSWLLMESVGAIRTSILCGLFPLLMVFVLSRFEARPIRKHSWGLSGALFSIGLFLFVSHNSPFDRESKYFALMVKDKMVGERNVKALALDALVHSCIDLNDPSFLYYPHEEIQASLTRAAAQAAREAGRTLRVLVIGGGGYSYPRWVESQADLSDVQIDVVEIDPAVTEIAHDMLGLSRDTRIVSINRDGRQFVKSAPAESYDLIIQDAVNDLSVPYHLMTAEYNQLLRRLLRPDCLYLLTVIDNFDSGCFLASAVRTTEFVFGESSLLLPEKPTGSSRQVFVLASRNSSADSGSQDFFTKDEQRLLSNRYIVPQSDIAGLLNRCAEKSPLLTDDYAPVDVLMSSQFLRRNSAVPSSH